MRRNSQRLFKHIQFLESVTVLYIQKSQWEWLWKEIQTKSRRLLHAGCPYDIQNIASSVNVWILTIVALLVLAFLLYTGLLLSFMFYRSATLFQVIVKAILPFICWLVRNTIWRTGYWVWVQPPDIQAKMYQLLLFYTSCREPEMHRRRKLYTEHHWSRPTSLTLGWSLLGNLPWLCFLYYTKHHLV